MTDTTYSESYFSEKDFEQVISACKFALDELNMDIFDEEYMNDKYCIVGDEKWNWSNSPFIENFLVQLEKDNKGTDVTIVVDYGWALGPWCKNHGIKIVKEFIKSVKSELARHNLEPENLISEAHALKKFADLRDQGIITEEEFYAKKKQILGL